MILNTLQCHNSRLFLKLQQTIVGDIKISPRSITVFSNEVPMNKRLLMKKSFVLHVPDCLPIINTLSMTGSVSIAARSIFNKQYRFLAN